MKRGWVLWVVYVVAMTGLMRAMTDDWFVIVGAVVAPVAGLATSGAVDWLIDLAGGASGWQ